MANSLASVYPCATFRMRFEEDSSFRLVFKEDNDFCTKMDKITFRVLDPPEYYTGPYEVTPSPETQTLATEQKTLIHDVTVSAIPSNYADTSDATIDASEVLSGEVAYGYDNVEQKAVKIVGTMPKRGNLGTITLDKDTTSYVVPNGHISGGTVQIVLEQKSATPTKSTQTINPSSGKVLSQLTVDPIPVAYQDVTEVDAVASDVLSGKKIVDSRGTVLVGSMPNKGAFVGTIDGLNTMSCAIPQGYHNGNGSVLLTNDIENELDEILNGASE